MLRRVQRHPRERRRRSRRRIVLAALAAGSLSACGQDIYAPPILGGDCCVSGVYYTCPTATGQGLCLAQPPNTSGCTLQVDQACPAGSP